MNSLLWLLGYPIWALIGVIATRLVLYRRIDRLMERVIKDVSDAELRAAECQIAQNTAQTVANAYGDALNDIVDLADWSAGLPAARAIARQARETGAYPGRLRAAQDALEEAEMEIQDLQAENVRLAELAVTSR